MADVDPAPRTVPGVRRSNVVGQLSLFLVEEVEDSTPAVNDRSCGRCPGGAIAQRSSGRTVAGEGASAGLAPHLKEAPVTAIGTFTCPSCALAGEPSPALDVCWSCQSAALEQVQGT